MPTNLRHLALLALILPLPAVAQPPTPSRGSSTATVPRQAPNPRAELQDLQTRYQQINEPELQQPPKRDVKIETGPLQKTKLFRADPKLFENKFVARFTLNSRRTDNGARMDDRYRLVRLMIVNQGPEEIVAQLALDDGSLADKPFGRSETPSNFMQALARHCPADQRPTAILDVLTSPDFDRDARVTRAEGGRLDFTLYAPTAEMAQDRALAIIRLHDCAISRPLQQYFLTQGRDQLAKASPKCDEYDRLSAEISAEQQQLKEPSEVSPDILSQLKAQRVLVAVELAGLQARVKACDKMLADATRLPPSTLQSVSDMKVKAEIELVGTQEKLSRIDAYVAEGNRREALQKNIQDLTARRSTVRQAAATDLREAESDLGMLEYFAPREIKDNTITISPLEWTDQ